VVCNGGIALDYCSMCKVLSCHDRPKFGGKRPATEVMLHSYREDSK